MTSPITRAAALTVVLASTALAAAAPALAADERSTLAINGTGVALVTPDRATLTVDVRSGAFSRERARSKANVRTRAVLAALARLAIARKDIQTTGIALRRTRKDHRTFYAASNEITVLVSDVTKTGPAIDGVTTAGADDVSGPYFTFSDPSAGRTEAARAALADARARAGDLAAASGQTITGVKTIVVDPSSGPEPYAEGGASSAPLASRKSAPSEPTQISPGQQEVEAVVQVVYYTSAV